MLKLHLAFQWLVTCLCRKYIGQIFTDSLVHDEKALKFLVDIIGEVRHLFQLFSCIYYKYIEVNKQILQYMHPMKFNCKTWIWALQFTSQTSRIGSHTLFPTQALSLGGPETKQQMGQTHTSEEDGHHKLFLRLKMICLSTWVAQLDQCIVWFEG